MAKSLQDQLLGAGIATEEQLKKAQESKQKPKKSQKAQSRPKQKPKKKKRPVSDLAQFYQQRSLFEKKTREEEEKKKKEAARLKKLNNKKIRKLLLDNLQNVEEAEVRFNFVVGNNIKYLYVTEQQQEALSTGELAITFLGGRRCLIPSSIIPTLRELEPNKLIIRLEDDEKADQTSQR